MPPWAHLAYGLQFVASFTYHPAALDVSRQEFKPLKPFPGFKRHLYPELKHVENESFAEALKLVVTLA
ncbi:MAG: hypothetical protein DMF69_06255 [Acidobacteria bacterium]|nr:MAG: hypothetical protein DMF69_06255 [Acidobacteriota bacterium]